MAKIGRKVDDVPLGCVQMEFIVRKFEVKASHLEQILGGNIVFVDHFNDLDRIAQNQVLKEVPKLWSRCF